MRCLTQLCLMDIIEYDDSAHFLERAAPVLSRNEAFTGLIYGVADRVGRIAEMDPDEDPPFLATVEQDTRSACSPS